jgi:demethylmenaquinone methyltransferase/2-methoxy-6-polyprenyl-1,4-benzoquinol methylase
MPVLREVEAPFTPAAAADLPTRIFSPVAPGYDRPAQILGLFQYRPWHRSLLSRLDLPPGARVLDMATGTGALALDLLDRGDVQVVAADITRPMLREAQSRAGKNGKAAALQLLQCSAEAPPIAESSIDAITFAYLLRYVSDVPQTLRSLSSLLRPGGTMVSLDFAVPRGVWYPLWRLYTDGVLPIGGRLFSRDWGDVGAFLGPSIRDFYRRWPEARLVRAWEDAGMCEVKSRRLSLGGAIVMWGKKSE